MNSVAIVEHPAGERRLYYMVTIVSNVLRKNSGTVHMELATRIQRLVEALHPAASPSPSPSTPPSPLAPLSAALHPHRSGNHAVPPLVPIGDVRCRAGAALP
jgi:hypothetical protein